jgi:hypothetical protein
VPEIRGRRNQAHAKGHRKVNLDPRPDNQGLVSGQAEGLGGVGAQLGRGNEEIRTPRGIVGASPFVSSIFDKKYEASSIAIDPSVFVGASRRNAWRTSGISMYPKRAVTWMIPSLVRPSGFDLDALGVANPGVGNVLIVTITRCSWRTSLCSTFARRANGAVLLPRKEKPPCRGRAVVRGV